MATTAATQPDTDPVWADFSLYRVHHAPTKLILTHVTRPYQHAALFYTSASLKGGKSRNKPDIAVRRIDASLLSPTVLADGRTLTTKEAKVHPLVASAHWRHTPKRIGLWVRSCDSEGWDGESKPDEAQEGAQEGTWEVMHRETVAGSRYGLTIPGHDHEKVNRLSSAREALLPTATNSMSKSRLADVDIKSETITAPISSGRPPNERAVDVVLESADQRGGRRYTWKRTHSPESGLENAWLFRVMSAANWKLVDEATQEIVAVFESNGLKSFRKVGRLRLRRDVGGGLAGLTVGEVDGRKKEFGGVDEEWLTWVLLSYAVIEERARRDM